MKSVIAVTNLEVEVYEDMRANTIEGVLFEVNKLTDFYQTQVGIRLLWLRTNADNDNHYITLLEGLDMPLSKTQANKYIKHSQDRAELVELSSDSVRPVDGPDLNETEELSDIELFDKTPMSTYNLVKGKTPADKMERIKEVGKKVGKEVPTQKDITTDNRERKVADNIKAEQANHVASFEKAVLVANEEFGVDYKTHFADSFAEGMKDLTVGFELDKFSADWKSIMKLLSNAAHPDKGGSETAQQFVNMLNEVFKGKRKSSKKIDLQKTMTDRIEEIMKGGK